MPYQWNAERERLMLLLAVSSSNLKPSANTWSAVAGLLGEGLTPSAVSQKYYKMRKESVKLYYNGTPILTPPATPTKRKASFDDDDEAKHQTPTKRAKKPIKKEEVMELKSSSDYSNVSSFSAYNSSYPQPPYFPCEMKQMSMRVEEGTGLVFGNENNGF